MTKVTSIRPVWQSLRARRPMGETGNRPTGDAGCAGGARRADALEEARSVNR